MIDQGVGYKAPAGPVASYVELVQATGGDNPLLEFSKTTTLKSQAKNTVLSVFSSVPR